MHFQKFQDGQKLCILKITLFAYDYLFKQQGNLHDEYPVNKNLLNKKGHLKWKKQFQPRGTAWALSIIWGSQVKIQESLKDSK